MPRFPNDALAPPTDQRTFFTGPVEVGLRKGSRFPDAPLHPSWRDLVESRWNADTSRMSFWESAAGQRARDDGEALFDWLTSMLSKHHAIEALDLLLDRVIEGELSEEALHYARGCAAGNEEARSVLNAAMGILTTVRPNHWK